MVTTKKSRYDLGTAGARQEQLRRKGRAVYSGIPDEEEEKTKQQTVSQSNAIPEWEYAPSSTEQLYQQTTAAKNRADEAANEKERAYKQYEQFLNQQTDVDNIDFLRDGPQVSAKANAQRDAYWQSYHQANDNAKKTKKEARALEWDLNARIKNPTTDAYWSEDLSSLKTQLDSMEEAVTNAQDAVLAAEASYSSLINQTDTDNLVGGMWTETQETARQQAQADWEAKREILEKALRQREILSDTYLYRSDMETISQMDPLTRAALENLVADGNILKSLESINALSDTQRQQLRNSGNYYEFLKNPEQFLQRCGYSQEDLSHLKETYKRYLNKGEMQETQETAESIGESMPILGTLSTYPAKLIGDVAQDVSAVTSGLFLGNTGYHNIDTNASGYGLNVYTDALRDRVADNLGDLGGTIYNVANGAIDDTGKYAVSALTGNPYFAYSGTFGETVRDAVDYGASLDQAFNLGVGSVALDVAKDQVLDAIPNSTANNFKKNIYDNTMAYISKELIDYLFELHPRYAALVEEMKRKGIDEKEAQKAAYYQFVLSYLM